MDKSNSELELDDSSAERFAIAAPLLRTALFNANIEAVNEMMQATQYKSYLIFSSTDSTVISRLITLYDSVLKEIMQAPSGGVAPSHWVARMCAAFLCGARLQQPATAGERERAGASLEAFVMKVSSYATAWSASSVDVSQFRGALKSPSATFKEMESAIGKSVSTPFTQRVVLRLAFALTAAVLSSRNEAKATAVFARELVASGTRYEYVLSLYTLFEAFFGVDSVRDKLVSAMCDRSAFDAARCAVLASALQLSANASASLSSRSTSLLVNRMNKLFDGVATPSEALLRHSLEVSALFDRSVDGVASFDATLCMAVLRSGFSPTEYLGTSLGNALFMSPPDERLGSVPLLRYVEARQTLATLFGKRAAGDKQSLLDLIELVAGNNVPDASEAREQRWQQLLELLCALCSDGIEWDVGSKLMQCAAHCYALLFNGVADTGLNAFVRVIRHDYVRLYRDSWRDHVDELARALLEVSSVDLRPIAAHWHENSGADESLFVRCALALACDASMTRIDRDLGIVNRHLAEYDDGASLSLPTTLLLVSAATHLLDALHNENALVLKVDWAPTIGDARWSTLDAAGELNDAVAHVRTRRCTIGNELVVKLQRLKERATFSVLRSALEFLAPAVDKFSDVHRCESCKREASEGGAVSTVQEALVGFNKAIAQLRDESTLYGALVDTCPVDDECAALTAQHRRVERLVASVDNERLVELHSKSADLSRGLSTLFDDDRDLLELVTLAARDKHTYLFRMAALSAPYTCKSALDKIVRVLRKLVKEPGSVDVATLHLILPVAVGSSSEVSSVDPGARLVQMLERFAVLDGGSFLDGKKVEVREFASDIYLLNTLERRLNALFKVLVTLEIFVDEDSVRAALDNLNSAGQTSVSRDFPTLKSLRTLNEVKAAVSSIERRLCNVPLRTLAVFECMDGNADMIAMVRYILSVHANLNSMIEYLQPNVMHGRYEFQLLQLTRSVGEALKPMYEAAVEARAARTDAERTSVLRTLMSALGRVPDYVDRHLSALERAANQLVEMRALLSRTQVSGTLQTLAEILDTGHLRLDVRLQSVSVEYTAGTLSSTASMETLLDLERWLHVFFEREENLTLDNGDANSQAAKARRAAEQFPVALQGIRGLFADVRALYELGHPSYVEECYEYKLSELPDGVAEHLERWRDCMTAPRKNSVAGELLLLRPRERALFVRECSRALCAWSDWKQEDKSSFAASIGGHLQVCMSLALSAAVSNEKMIETVLSAFNTLCEDESNVLEPDDALQMAARASKVVEHVAQHLEADYSSLPTLEQHQEQLELLRLHESDDDSDGGGTDRIYDYLFVANGNAHVRNAQLIDCRHDALTDAWLDSFLTLPLALGEHDQLCFYIVAPEFLPLRRLRRVIEYCERYVDADFITEFATKVVLVCVSDRYADLFDDIRRFRRIVPSDGHPRPLASNVEVQLYGGDAGIGKSHTALHVSGQKKATGAATVRLFLSEKCTSRHLLPPVREALRTLSGGGDLVLYLDVSGYANHARVQLILSDLLYTSMMRDDDDGHILYVADNVRVLVLLEIGSVPVSDVYLTSSAESPCVGLQQSSKIVLALAGITVSPVCAFPDLAVEDVEVCVRWHAASCANVLCATLPLRTGEPGCTEQKRVLNSIRARTEEEARAAADALVALVNGSASSASSRHRLFELFRLLSARLAWLREYLKTVRSWKPSTSTVSPAIADLDSKYLLRRRDEQSVTIKELYEKILTESAAFVRTRQLGGHFYPMWPNAYRLDLSGALQSLSAMQVWLHVDKEFWFRSQRGLQQCLAAVCGVSVECVHVALRRLHFVVTAQIVRTLALIRTAQMSAGSVVLCGDSGVGKTAVLRLLVEIINSKVTKKAAATSGDANDVAVPTIPAHVLSVEEALLHELFDCLNDMKAGEDVIDELCEALSLASNVGDGDAKKKELRDVLCGQRRDSAQWPFSHVFATLRSSSSLSDETRMLIAQRLCHKCVVCMRRHLRSRVRLYVAARLAGAGLSEYNVDVLVNEHIFHLLCDSSTGDSDIAGDLSALETVMRAWRTLKRSSLVETVLVSRRLTQARLDHMMATFIECAHHCAQATGKLAFTVFFDELNTAGAIMGSLKAIVVDRLFNGQPLPDQLTVIGAINPFGGTIMRTDAHVADRARVYDFRATRSLDADDFEEDRASQRERREFIVRPLHPSVEEFVVRVPPFVVDGELSNAEHFVASMFLNEATVAAFGVDAAHSLCSVTQLCIRALSDANIFRVKPSMRQVSRMRSFYTYFRQNKGGKALMRLSLASLNADASEVAGLESVSVQHYWALLHAVYLAFYLSFERDLSDEATSKRWTRAAFASRLFARLSTFDAYPAVLGDSAASIEQLFVGSTRSLFACADVAVHPIVAYTSSLLENLFAVTVCIDAGVSVALVGPAGVSKTLSFSLAVHNLERVRAPPFDSMVRVRSLRFQCTRSTTDADIRELYTRAADMELDGVRVVVQLEEVGLLSEWRMPLKEIHYHLDNTEICSVMLSNVVLDSAKMNRCALVLQMEPSADDIERLAAAYLFDACSLRAFDALSDERRQIVQALCATVCALLSSEGDSVRQREFGVPIRCFGQRDAVYFLRCLRELLATDNDSSAGSVSYWSPDHIVTAVGQNFGGVSFAAHRAIVARFVGSLGGCLRWTEEECDVSRLCPHDRTLDALRHTLGRVVRHDENVQTAAFRHVMVIDASDSRSALQVLFDPANDLLPANTPVVELCGDFEKDGSENELLDRILQVKQAMSRSGNLVMVGTAAIHSAFYDVFNRHFRELVTSEAGGAEQRRFYAALGVGSHSENCVVSPNFRVLLVVRQCEVPSMPLPWLSRFEAYTLSPSLLFEETLRAGRIGPHRASIMRRLHYAGVHFARAMLDDNVNLCGVRHENVGDVVAARLVRVLRLSAQSDDNDGDVDSEEWMPTLRLSLRDVTFDSADAWSTEAADDLDHDGDANGSNAVPLRDAFHDFFTDTKPSLSQQRSSTPAFALDIKTNLGADPLLRLPLFDVNDTSMSLDDRLRRRARLLNFELLQVGAANQMMRSDLTRRSHAYQHEYFVAQEHLSCARLLKRLLDASEPTAAFLCLYTRSESLWYSVDDHVDAMAKAINISASQLCLIALNGVDSSRVLKRRIDHAYKPESGTRLLLIVVDVEAMPRAFFTLQTMVENASRCNGGSECSVKCAVMLHSNASAHTSLPPSIAVGADWHYHYCDSSGFHNVDARDDRIGASNQRVMDKTASAVVALDKSLAAELSLDDTNAMSDARAWVAIIAGAPLGRRALHSKSLQQLWKRLEWIALYDACKRVKMPRLSAALRERDAESEWEGADVYPSAIDNLRSKFLALACVLRAHPALFDAALHHCRQRFGEEMRSMVLAECAAIQSDIASHGIEDVAVGAARRLFVNALLHFVAKLSFHFNLPCVLLAVRGAHWLRRCALRFVRSEWSVLPLRPTPLEYLEGGARHINIVLPVSELGVATRLADSYALRFPFFDALLESLRAALLTAMLSERSPSALVDSLTRHNASLLELVAFVEADTELCSLFMSEFVRLRLLARTKLTEQWISLAATVFHTLLGEGGFGACVGAAYSELAAINGVDTLRWIVETFCALEAPTPDLSVEDADGRTLLCLLAHACVDALWSDLLACTTNADESRLLAIWTCVRTIRARHRSRAHLYALLGGDQSGKRTMLRFDLLCVLYTVALHTDRLNVLSTSMLDLVGRDVGVGGELVFIDEVTTLLLSGVDSDTSEQISIDILLHLCGFAFPCAIPAASDSVYDSSDCLALSSSYLDDLLLALGKVSNSTLFGLALWQRIRAPLYAFGALVHDLYCGALDNEQRALLANTCFRMLDNSNKVVSKMPTMVRLSDRSYRFLCELGLHPQLRSGTEVPTDEQACGQWSPLHLILFQCECESAYLNVKSITSDRARVRALYERAEKSGGNVASLMRTHALRRALLRLLASDISNALDRLGHESGDDATTSVADVIRADWCADGDTAMLRSLLDSAQSQLFLLSELGDGGHVRCLLNDETLLELLAMASFAAKSSNRAEDSGFHRFRFMLPSATDSVDAAAFNAQSSEADARLRVIYASVKASFVTDTQKADSLLRDYKSGRDLNGLRMCLLLCAFYEGWPSFAVLRQRSETVRTNILQFVKKHCDALYLDAAHFPIGVTLFEFICGGPRSSARQFDVLEYLFSEQLHVTNIDDRDCDTQRSLCAAFVNVAAIVLGCTDANALHMSQLLMNGRSQPARHMVGATVHVLKDCYYQFVANTARLQPSSLFGGRHHAWRLALNASVWISVAFSQLLEAGKWSDFHFGHAHLLNTHDCPRWHSAFEKAQRAPNHVDTVRSETWFRCVTFLTHLRNEPDVGLAEHNYVHFFNEYLQQLWVVSNAPQRDTRLRASFGSAAQASAYESYLQSGVFTVVASQMPAAKAFMVAAANESPVLRSIDAMRVDNAEALLSFVEAPKRLSSIVESEGSTEAANHLVELLCSFGDQFDMVDSFVRILRFVRLMLRTLDNVVPHEWRDRGFVAIVTELREERALTGSVAQRLLDEWELAKASWRPFARLATALANHNERRAAAGDAADQGGCRTYEYGPLTDDLPFVEMTHQSKQYEQMGLLVKALDSYAAALHKQPRADVRLGSGDVKNLEILFDADAEISVDELIARQDASMLLLGGGWRQSALQCDVFAHVSASSSTASNQWLTRPFLSDLKVESSVALRTLGQRLLGGTCRVDTQALCNEAKRFRFLPLGVRASLVEVDTSGDASQEDKSKGKAKKQVRIDAPSYIPSSLSFYWRRCERVRAASPLDVPLRDDDAASIVDAAFMRDTARLRVICDVLAAVVDFVGNESSVERDDDDTGYGEPQAEAAQKRALSVDMLLEAVATLALRGDVDGQTDAVEDTVESRNDLFLPREIGSLALVHLKPILHLVFDASLYASFGIAWRSTSDDAMAASILANYCQSIASGHGSVRLNLRARWSTLNALVQVFTDSAFKSTLRTDIYSRTLFKHLVSLTSSNAVASLTRTVGEMRRNGTVPFVEELFNSGDACRLTVAHVPRVTVWLMSTVAALQRELMSRAERRRRKRDRTDESSKEAAYAEWIEVRNDAEEETSEMRVKEQEGEKKRVEVTNVDEKELKEVMEEVKPAERAVGEETVKEKKSSERDEKAGEKKAEVRVQENVDLSTDIANGLEEAAQVVEKRVKRVRFRLPADSSSSVSNDKVNFVTNEPVKSTSTTIRCCVRKRSKTVRRYRFKDMQVVSPIALDALLDQLCALYNLGEHRAHCSVLVDTSEGDADRQWQPLRGGGGSDGVWLRHRQCVLLEHDDRDADDPSVTSSAKQAPTHLSIGSRVPCGVQNKELEHCYLNSLLVALAFARPLSGVFLHCATKDSSFSSLLCASLAHIHQCKSVLTHADVRDLRERVRNELDKDKRDREEAFQDVSVTFDVVCRLLDADGGNCAQTLLDCVQATFLHFAHGPHGKPDVRTSLFVDRRGAVNADVQQLIDGAVREWSMTPRVLVVHNHWLDRRSGQLPPLTVNDRLQLVDKSRQEHSYSVLAVIFYIGAHYLTVVRVDGRYYYVSDEYTKPFELETILNARNKDGRVSYWPYLIVYEKIE